MKLTDPGKFREPIAIQAMTRTDDDAGGYTETWTDVRTSVFAEIEALEGNEQIRAMQTDARGTHRVRTWAIEGIKSTTHQIRRVRDGAVLEIVAPPIYDETRLQMEILTREIET